MMTDRSRWFWTLAKTLIKEILPLIDAVAEVVDARVPARAIELRVQWR
ncbi:MAG: hypothetical protein ACLR56_14550 [Oscillospiraceae bacterium]